MKLNLTIIFSVMYLFFLPINGKAQGYKLLDLNIPSHYKVEDYVLNPNHNYVALLFLKKIGDEFIPEYLLYDLANKKIDFIFDYQRLDLHSWNGPNELVLGDRRSNLYKRMNINTLKIDSIEGLHDEYDALVINKKLEVYSSEYKDKYFIRKNNKIIEKKMDEKTYVDYCDEKTKRIIEVLPLDTFNYAYVIQEYNYKTNRRKKIATIEGIGNPFFRIFNGKLFYRKVVYGEFIAGIRSYLLSLDLASGDTELIYKFEPNVKCVKFDVLADNKFIVLLDNELVEDKTGKNIEIVEYTIEEVGTVGIIFCREVKLLVKTEEAKQIKN